MAEGEIIEERDETLADTEVREEDERWEKTLKLLEDLKIQLLRIPEMMAQANAELIAHLPPPPPENPVAEKEEEEAIIVAAPEETSAGIEESAPSGWRLRAI